ERCAELCEPAELQREVVRPEAHLLQPGWLAGERGESAVLLQTHLLERGAGQSLRAPRLEQPQHRVQPQLQRAAVAQPGVAGAAGDERHVDAVLGTSALA